MHHKLIKPGVFELYYGAMKSGKTRSLINRVEQLLYFEDIHFIVIQPQVNTREDVLKSRFSSVSLPTVVIDVTKPETILDHIQENTVLVAIDELQVFDSSVVAVIDALQKKNINVVAAGLSLDFRGEPFGCMSQLMPLVDEPHSLSGVCEYAGCNKPGTRTQRLVNGEPAKRSDPTLVIEGSEDAITYQTRCLHHFKLKEE
jgi:thymidine kinase